MPRVIWPHLNGRPRIQVVLEVAGTGQLVTHDLLADTGAGTASSP
jgi:hypothetical protein